MEANFENLRVINTALGLQNAGQIYISIPGPSYGFIHHFSF